MKLLALDGSKIEHLLWENSVDTKVEGDEFEAQLQSTFSDCTVVLYDVWFDGSYWFVDSLNITAERLDEEGHLVAEFTGDVESEEDLVKALVSLGDW